MTIRAIIIGLCLSVWVNFWRFLLECRHLVCHGFAPSGCDEADQYSHWSGFSTAVVSLSADDDCICLFHEIRCVVQHLVFSPARHSPGWHF